QKWHSGFRTKRDAERALSEIVASLHSGTYVEPTKQTLAEFAREWLFAVQPTIRPSTHHSYDRNLRLHVLPQLGSVELRRIDAGMLNALYAALLADGKRTTANGGAGGLSSRSVRYIHTIVHRAFRDAVRWGRIARNPADAADPPRASATARPTMKTWTADQVRAFLDHTAEHRLHAAFVLLATTGMRRGEALGLRWSDVDLTAGRASISQTVIMVHHDIEVGSPKTARGRRTVALDPGTVAALREHRKRQAAERLLMGVGFTDHGLAFCLPDGRPLHPERFSRTFSRQTAHAGLPAIRLHDLRHTWATLALSAGEHPKVVQERLGHANVSITLDVYSHVSEGLHSDAASRIAKIIFGPVSSALANTAGSSDE
ncbi:MAG TPA: tyrosine-type recombinase/integrase, partial [Propionibacteriaceae bacterium]|nr:tyrosine-type recombinase/integrase [Propionibacteriaceae bacterium]